MARRSQRNNPEQLRTKLITLLEDFEQKLQDCDLRKQVLSLVSANYCLRDLGSSLIEDDNIESARDRILAYLRRYPGVAISSEELMVVAGISEYARRIRELRVEHGWPIFSGLALKEMLTDDHHALPQPFPDETLKKDTYILTENRQDRDAAYRWRLANDIRKSKEGVKQKLLKYFRANVGKPITGEELKYLANNASEWPRRVRELRTEEGWPIATRVTGMPNLAVGTYVLEEDRQAPTHDRKIPDPVRIQILERDGFTCRHCGWSPENANSADRYRTLLELHHIEHHAKGGANTPENLITLCNICHDEVHRGNIAADTLTSILKS